MNNKTVKIAAARTGHNSLPMEANPYSRLYDIDALLKYADENAKRTFDSFIKAGEAGADIVISTEGIRPNGHLSACVDRRADVFVLAEELPGPTSDRLGEISIKYNMYTAANYIIREGDKVYNTTVLVGRDGKIIGRYDKIHLPASEHWHITPGTEIPVFETDIGRIGFSTCHDIAFPEHGRAMALNGADIILHPTNGWGFVINNGALGMELLRVRAAENFTYIAASYSINHLRPDSSSCIIGNKGDILAENRDQENDGIAIAEYQPNYDMQDTKNMWSFFSGVTSERMRLIHERIPEAYKILTDEAPPVIKSFYPEYKYAKTPDEIRPIADIHDKARTDEANGIENELWEKKW
jgi:predicted amidohydrolase